MSLYSASQGISDEYRKVLHEIGRLFGRGKMIDEDGEVIETKSNPEISYKLFFYAEKQVFFGYVLIAAVIRQNGRVIRDK